MGATYQWQVCFNNDDVWHGIFNPSVHTYNTGRLDNFGMSEYIYQYRVVTLNSYGLIFSVSAVSEITVLSEKDFITPASVTACENESVNLKLNGSYDPYTTFQWQVDMNNNNNWSSILGATEMSYTTEPLTANVDYKFRVMITEALAAPYFSYESEIYVLPVVNDIISPSAITVSADESVELYLSVKLTKFMSIEWQVYNSYGYWSNCSLPILLDQRTYNTDPLPNTGTSEVIYKYRALVIDPIIGSYFSDVAVITVVSPIKITYTYDASGNMEKREMVIDMSSKSGLVKSSTVKTGEVGETEEMGETEFPKYEDVLSEMKITIYPNPTQGKLRVDITGGEIARGARIYLYNMQGMMICQLTSVSTTNELDISAQPAGTYIMKIMLDKDKISTWTIIKD
jgi:hypothetical protein